MATPIAHKGVTAGAKVQAMTLVDLLLKPEVITAAWDYFKNVQTRDAEVRGADPPAGHAGDRAQPRHHGEVPRADEASYYFDPTKYKTYLEQLGIKYPGAQIARAQGQGPRPRAKVRRAFLDLWPWAFGPI